MISLIDFNTIRKCLGIDKFAWKELLVIAGNDIERYLLSLVQEQIKLYDA